MTATVRDPGQSALSAFRTDMPVGGRSTTAVDDETLAVATLLQHACLAPGTPESDRMVASASAVAQASLGEERLSYPCDCDSPGDESPLDVFRKLGERCMDLGQIRLEDHLNASVERLAPPGSLTAGRAAFRRARQRWEAGDFDLAQAQVESLLDDPRWNRHEELVLRGSLVLGALAHTHGNFPEAASRYQRVAQASVERYTVLAGAGVGAIGTLAALKGDFDTALEYMWRSYELVKGISKDRERKTLANISQMLLDAGYPAAARSGFARALTDPQQVPRMLPLVGGYATASAALGDLDGVNWATRQVLQLAKLRTNSRQIADALLECSMALAAVGEDTRAGTLRRRFTTMAEQHGFHDLMFRAQSAATPALTARPRSSEAAKVVADRISEMAPASVPLDLVHA